MTKPTTCTRPCRYHYPQSPRKYRFQVPIGPHNYRPCGQDLDGIRRDMYMQIGVGPEGKTVRCVLGKDDERAERMVYQDTTVRGIPVLSSSQRLVLARVRLVRQRAHVTTVIRVWPLDRYVEKVVQNVGK